MSKLKKGIALIKKGVNDPTLIVKGFKYMKNNGLKGFRDNINGRIVYEQAMMELLEEERQVCNGEIKFSILMPVYNVETHWLEAAIQSVIAQGYQNWELCIADDCSTDARVAEYLQSIQHEKIKICCCQKNGGISQATNQAAALASGDFFVLMDNDDVITANALTEFYREIQQSNPDILYSDQDIIDEKGVRSNPFLKPDWSPDLFLSQMYLGHLLGFRKELFEQVGGFQSKCDGSQDYDLLLRMTEHTKKVAHVPKILYSWRSLPTSTAVNPNAKPYAQTAGQLALQEHLDRKLGAGKASAEETENLFVYDVRYEIPGEPLVSIIMPTKDHLDLVEQAVASIFEKTQYKNFEILILDNNSEEEKTKKGLALLAQRYPNISVVEAAFPFNWSKLNNFGMRHAKGEVFVFLNNDIKVLSDQWLRRITEHALRPETGVVGGLLLYEDKTIQHAGVVVGMGGWADHVFKGMQPVHWGSPFLSPMVTRNVLACTGACMGISRKTIEQIGNFDEQFIICGSDVEICIRAYQQGFYNVYSPYVRLLHYESKTRDTYVPAVDMECSRRAYLNYLKKGDPFYNLRLDLFSNVPKEMEFSPEIQRITQKILEKRGVMEDIPDDMKIAEINPYRLRKTQYPRKRLNLLVPSVNPEHVFGGISTALKFFQVLCESCGYDRRLIIVDAPPTAEGLSANAKGYTLTQPEDNTQESCQVVPYSFRAGKSIPVSEQDFFVFTGWWTAHCMQEAYEELEEEINLKPNVFLYLIQDYEPGFYPWSSKYLLADATYRHSYPTIAIFNSSLLQQHFQQNGYQFAQEFVFEPVLNDKLKEHLLALPQAVKKKKQVLIYGRPGTQRNAFELILAAIRKWIQLRPDAGEWEFLSAGEDHKLITLGGGLKIKSLGKLTIEAYAKVLEESYAGISLMVSPHPSYPPLEMAVFGVKVVTNSFLNKDLSSFHKNIVSIKTASPNQIAKGLSDICSDYEEIVTMESTKIPYIENKQVFGFTQEIVKMLEGDTKEI